MFVTGDEMHQYKSTVNKLHTHTSIIKPLKTIKLGYEQSCSKRKTRKINQCLYIVDTAPCLCNTFRVVEAIPTAVFQVQYLHFGAHRSHR